MSSDTDYICTLYSNSSYLSCSLSLSNSYVGYQMLIKRMVHESFINSPNGDDRGIDFGYRCETHILHSTFRTVYDVDHVCIRSTRKCRVTDWGFVN